ncbi:MAG: hypothetical protein DRI84_00555 [Bacteroidetes bacterium]|nr:MAG: hypothetical protein DRI84_00555 [Bacteroidota bacterium]
MKKTVLIIFIVGIVLTYGFIEQPKDGISMSSITGNDLFQKNCASCHGEKLQGKPPTFPSLLNIESKLSKEEVNKLLETGRGVMPSFAHLSQQDRVAITGFLFGENTKVSIETKQSPQEKGSYFFTANCASCHKISENDATPTGRKDWGRTPANLGGVNKDISFESFTNILNMGPCYMPSFSHLSSEEKSSIYKFLSAVENSEGTSTENSRKRSCSGNCNCARK